MLKTMVGCEVLHDAEDIVETALYLFSCLNACSDILIKISTGPDNRDDVFDQLGILSTVNQLPDYFGNIIDKERFIDDIDGLVAWREISLVPVLSDTVL